MQYSGHTTTADSTSEERMKVDAGCCQHGKKKCLKCAISSSPKKVGKKKESDKKLKNFLSKSKKW